VALTLLSSRYAEYIDPSVNADKFYLVCVWQDQASNSFMADVRYGRRGSDGQVKEYYRGASRSQADGAANKQWSTKTGNGYRPATMPSTLNRVLGRYAGATVYTAGPSATTKNYVPLASPVPVSPVAIAAWAKALLDDEYVPVEAIVIDPSAVRIALLFDARGVAQLLEIEANPTGGHRGDREGLKTYAQAFFAKLDARKPVITDAVFDGWLIKSSRPILVVADVSKIDGIDVLRQPFSSRYLLVEQALSDLDGDDQAAGQWQVQNLLDRDLKGHAKPNAIWLRKIGALYNPGDTTAILRLA